jgi:hypothetical protein
MLDPKQRLLVLESLRPPPGMSLDIAVGTTFSLDLMALLTTPLAFTFFDWDTEDGRPTADPTALLEAIRRHADRIHIFCDAGRISVPRNVRPLFAYLEPCVHEVRAPDPDGVFHPKVWLVRFCAGDGRRAYRVLCATRNLTFDRSWDTLLALDGSPSDNAIEGNRPLMRLLQQLPAIAIRPVHADARQAMDTLVREIHHVRFEPPEGFDDLRFHLYGFGAAGGQPFDEPADRALLISPFLSPDVIEQMKRTGGRTTLVSRIDTLDTLNAATLDGVATFVLSDDATMDEGDDDAPAIDERLSGLHAKLYVTDRGQRSQLWTGSANATIAAFSRNVEFLTELRGNRRDCGVEAVLGEPGQGVTVLRDLLVEFEPKGSPEVKARQVELERGLEQWRRWLVDARLVATVTQSPGEETFSLNITASADPGPSPALAATVTGWPITLSREISGQRLGTEKALEFSFPSLSFEALTSFLAFEVEVSDGEEHAETRFVLNVPTSGFPSDRRQRLLRYMLKSKADVLRYLLLLLAENGLLSVDAFANLGNGRRAEQGPDRFVPDAPILEALLEALDRRPERLDDVSSLIADLRTSTAGEDLIPDGFDLIWEAIWEARHRL